MLVRMSCPSLDLIFIRAPRWRRSLKRSKFLVFKAICKAVHPDIPGPTHDVIIFKNGCLIILIIKDTMPCIDDIDTDKGGSPNINMAPRCMHVNRSCMDQGAYIYIVTSCQKQNPHLLLMEIGNLRSLRLSHTQTMLDADLGCQCPAQHQAKSVRNLCGFPNKRHEEDCSQRHPSKCCKSVHQHQQTLFAPWASSAFENLHSHLQHAVGSSHPKLDTPRLPVNASTVSLTVCKSMHGDAHSSRNLKGFDHMNASQAKANVN